MNAYKHGIYARHLFVTAEQWAADGKDYQMLAAGIRDFYRPKNFMAELCVEKVATGEINLARIFRQEQSLLASRNPFDSQRIDRILRCKTAAKKDLYRDLKELERLVARGDVIWLQLASSEAGQENDNGEAAAPCSNSTTGPDEPSHDAVSADGESTLPNEQENGADSRAEVWEESKTVIYERPADLPDPPQTTVPDHDRRERYERMRILLEGCRRDESRSVMAEIIEANSAMSNEPPGES